MMIAGLTSPGRGHRLSRLLQQTTSNIRILSELAQSAADPLIVGVLRKCAEIRTLAAGELWSCLTDRGSVWLEDDLRCDFHEMLMAGEQVVQQGCNLSVAIQTELRLEEEFRLIAMTPLRASLRRVILRQHRELKSRLVQLIELRDERRMVISA